MRRTSGDDPDDRRLKPSHMFRDIGPAVAETDFWRRIYGNPEQILATAFIKMKRDTAAGCPQICAARRAAERASLTCNTARPLASVAAFHVGGQRIELALDRLECVRVRHKDATGQDGNGMMVSLSPSPHYGVHHKGNQRVRHSTRVRTAKDPDETPKSFA
jgi:hypothetical protein